MKLLPASFLSFFLLVCAEAAASDLPLANTFDRHTHKLTDYYVSEKLDGVRAYWDGKRLMSRNGLVFSVPAWFVAGLPPEPLDGELWGGRNTFEVTSGVVRRLKPHSGWSKLTFMVFELPKGAGDFTARYAALQQLRQAFPSAYWDLVEQHEAPAQVDTMLSRLKALSAAGGEGFMLKRKRSSYKGGRSDDLLKLKLWQDAEATVLAHHQGKGRFAGMLGSMTVMTPDGLKFKIGSGFSDEQRRNPPPIGATIQYKYTGFTNKNRPKFPVFWRERSDS